MHERARGSSTRRRPPRRGRRPRRRSRGRRPMTACIPEPHRRLTVWPGDLDRHARPAGRPCGRRCGCPRRPGWRRRGSRRRRHAGSTPVRSSERPDDVRRHVVRAGPRAGPRRSGRRAFAARRRPRAVRAGSCWRHQASMLAPGLAIARRDRPRRPTRPLPHAPAGDRARGGCARRWPPSDRASLARSLFGGTRSRTWRSSAAGTPGCGPPTS